MRAIVLSMLFALAASAASAVDDSPPVKKSTNDICHERGWPNYERTKNFEPFDSMEACVASGGRAAENRPETVRDRLTKPKTWLAVIGAIAAAFGVYWFQRSHRRRARHLADPERRRWEGHRRE